MHAVEGGHTRAVQEVNKKPLTWTASVCPPSAAYIGVSNQNLYYHQYKIINKTKK